MAVWVAKEVACREEIKEDKAVKGCITKCLPATSRILIKEECHQCTKILTHKEIWAKPAIRTWVTMTITCLLKEEQIRTRVTEDQWQLQFLMASLQRQYRARTET